MKIQTTIEKTQLKQDSDHAQFLNSIRSRLKVDDATIANLEKRMGGKYPFTFISDKGMSHCQ